MVKKGSIKQELNKIDLKSDIAKGKKIVELYDTFTENPIAFLGIEPNIKDDLVSELMNRKITPSFQTTPRKNNEYEPSYHEYNFINEDKKPNHNIYTQRGINLDIGTDHKEMASLIEYLDDQDTEYRVKLINDDNGECNYLKQELKNKNPTLLEHYIESCKKELEIESDVFNTIIDKIKKKEDYFDLIYKQLLD